MALHHSLMAGCYHAHQAAKAVGRALGVVSANSLRVLTYHDVAPEHQDRLAAQLRWLARSWRFVSAGQFAELMYGAEPIRGRNLLVTFDDGFASQRRVAEQILNPMGVSALFFVVPDFVSLVAPGAAREFIARNIYPAASVDEIPPGWSNMGWRDLEALLEQGHSIGGHTLTHARLALLESESDLEREIIGGADVLTQRLGIAVEHFAYTFGDLGSFSPKAFSIARRRFRCIHSGLRGDNARHRSPFAIRREAVGAGDSLALVGAYVEGVADFRYARSRAQLASWM